MTDLSATTTDFGGDLAKPSTFSVEDIYWGYMIRSGRGPSFGVAIGQAVSFFFGVCFLTASLGILVLPTLFFDGDLGVMRIGSAALFGAMAAYLLWFASRGTRTEVHVDTSLAEIRDVVCNRAGKPTTVGAYGFDTIGGVFVEHNDATGLAQLVLRYRNTSQTVCVAEGTDAQLIPLRDRHAQDLLGQSKPRGAQAA
jgi:hypothetical protein